MAKPARPAPAVAPNRSVEERLKEVEERAKRGPWISLGTTLFAALLGGGGALAWLQWMDNKGDLKAKAATEQLTRIREESERLLDAQLKPIRGDVEALSIKLGNEPGIEKDRSLASVIAGLKVQIEQLQSQPGSNPKLTDELKQLLAGLEQRVKDRDQAQEKRLLDIEGKLNDIVMQSTQLVETFMTQSRALLAEANATSAATQSELQLVVKRGTDLGALEAGLRQGLTMLYLEQVRRPSNVALEGLGSSTWWAEKALRFDETLTKHEVLLDPELRAKLPADWIKTLEPRFKKLPDSPRD